VIVPIRCLLVILSAAGVAAVPSIVKGQLISDIGQLSSDISDYNLISLGDTTFNQVSDTAGGIAINGNLAINNNSTTLVGMMAAASGPSLYATGQLSISNGQTVHVNHGYGSLQNASGWSWSGSPSDNLTKSMQGTLHFNSNTTLDPLAPANNPNWNWSNLASSLTGISGALDTTSTGMLSVVSQNLVLNNNGATSGVVVFNFNGASLGGLSSINITVPSNLIYVINVTGLSAGASFLSGVNINSGTNSGALIWNFNTRTDGNFTLANNGKFYGNILAPGLTVTSNTYLENQVVVGGLTQNNDELDDVANLVAIPELPATSAWIGFMAVAFMALRALSNRVRRLRHAGV
jgi:hypothetical protein